MLIDLLSTANYNMYNITIANKLGLHSSIYLSELMNINDKAIRKNKLEDNYFTIDRAYIKSRTTLDEKEQKELDKVLFDLGILEKSKSNDCKVKLNVTELASLLMSDDEKLLEDVSNIIKKKPSKKTKDEAMLENLKSNIVTSNDELREAYYNWIEGVYAKEGWMTKQAVISGQRALDAYNTTRDLDVALKIIEIAALNGYRDITWAINTYNKDYKGKFSFPSTNTKVEFQPVQVGKAF